MDIYLIYDCDEWHTYSSFRFIAAVDEEHKKNMLEVIKQDHEYTDEDMKEYIHIDKVVLNEME